MDKIKATALLKTLSKKEILRFEDFLSSPYFNKGKKYITRFFKALKRHYPDFTDETDFKKNVYQKLYPKEKYNDLRFRKLSSELYKLLLEFLAAEQNLSETYEHNLKILSQLNHRKLDNLFVQELKNFQSFLQRSNLRNDRYNRSMYELLSAEKFFYFQRKRNRSFKMYDDEINYFTKFSLSLFLSKYIERAIEIRFFKAKHFSYPMFREVILFLKDSDFLNDPVIQLLYLQLTLCLKDDDKSYFKLKVLLKKTEKKIDKNQLKILYTILSNYAAERSEKGVPGFSEEILKINLEIIRKDLTEQFISVFLFINVITLFMKSNKTAELKKFISSNSGLLNPEIKTAVIDYSYSCLAFQKGDFEKALNFLSKINFDHYQLKFLIKNLTLKIYYEMDEYESIYSLMDSYKHILKRESDIPESIKKTISAFLKILKFLTDKKAVNKRTESKIDKKFFLKELDRSSPAEKEWLKDKISELII